MVSHEKEASAPSAAELLGIAPVGSLLVRYSLPAVASGVIASVYNVVAGAFIGHGVGPNGLTGLAVNFPLFNLVMGLCMMVGVGGATFCSMELGRGNERNAADTPGQVIMLGISLCVISSLLLYVVIDPVLRLFGASDATLPYARDYTVVVLAGLPASAVMVGLNHLMRASGHPLMALATMAFSIGINIVLAPLFIFVFHWGMKGAALATLLSEVAACAWLIAAFCRSRDVLRFRRGMFRWRPSLCLTILRYGLPPFLMNSCASLVVIVINRQLLTWGGDSAVGAYGIFNPLVSFVFMVVLGLTQGMQPIIGYNCGAGRTDRVRQATLLGLGAGLAVTAAGWAVMQGMPQVLAACFTNDAEVGALAVRALRTGGMLFLVVGAPVVITSCFQFMGMPLAASALSLSRQLVLLIPFLLILPRRYGLDGVWYSFPLADGLAALTALMALLYYRRKLGFNATPGSA